MQNITEFPEEFGELGTESFVFQKQRTDFCPQLLRTLLHSLYRQIRHL